MGKEWAFLSMQVCIYTIRSLVLAMPNDSFSLYKKYTMRNTLTIDKNPIAGEQCIRPRPIPPSMPANPSRYHLSWDP